MTPPQSKIPYLPDRITGLADLAHNLSWSWSHEARALFQAIDQPLWHLTRHNPIELLRRVDPARLAQCAEDAEFLRHFDEVMQRVEREKSPDGTWFMPHYGAQEESRVAYFRP